MEMKNKKAILVWSDGIETNYTEYTSTLDKTAVEQAQDQMHKEYQEHGEANEECGAFEGDMECYSDYAYPRSVRRIREISLRYLFSSVKIYKVHFLVQ